MSTICSATPVLAVREIAASVAFYREKLGFAARHEEHGFAIVQRDGVDLLLTQLADETWRTRTDLARKPVVSGAESFLSGTVACRVHVTGVDELFAEYAAQGLIHPNGPLTDQWWGDRDFSVLDRDGNLLTFYERLGRAAAPNDTA
jgi:catechol 2,3-dioxygenase-like lactoylglutathione lyase family enzyme